MASRFKPYIVDEPLTGLAMPHASSVLSTQTTTMDNLHLNSKHADKAFNFPTLASHKYRNGHEISINGKNNLHNPDFNGNQHHMLETTIKNETPSRYRNTDNTIATRNFTSNKNNNSKTRKKRKNKNTTPKRENSLTLDLSLIDNQASFTSDSRYGNPKPGRSVVTIRNPKQLLMQSSENQIDIIGGIDSDNSINNSNSNDNHNRNYINANCNQNIENDVISYNHGTKNDNNKGNNTSKKITQTPMVVSDATTTMTWKRDKSYNLNDNDNHHWNYAVVSSINTNNPSYYDYNDENPNYNYDYNYDYNTNNYHDNGYYDENGYWINYNYKNDDSYQYQAKSNDEGLETTIDSRPLHNQHVQQIHANYQSNTYTPELILFSDNSRSRSNTVGGSDVNGLSIDASKLVSLEICSFFIAGIRTVLQNGKCLIVCLFCIE